MSRINTTTEQGDPTSILPDDWRSTLVSRAKKAGQEIEPLDLEHVGKQIHRNFVANDINTWHFIGEEWCPVQETYKKVYWIPTSRISKDKHSQNRQKDSRPVTISAYANRMEIQGQLKAYSVWIKPDDSESVRRRWGNTRDRGLKELYDDSRVCEGNPPGCSRVHVYTDSLDKLPAWQSRENHIHEPGEPNDIKSDIESLAAAIENDLLDYGTCSEVQYDSSSKARYKDLTDDEKKERLRIYCKKFMVLRSGRNFNSFYKAYRRDKVADFSIRSWTSGELKKSFMTSNPFGLTKSHEVKASIANCFERDGVKYGVWFGSDIYQKGAYLQQVRKAKKISKAVDVSIFVTASEPSTTDQIGSSRNKIKTDLKGWNKISSKPDIDHCLHAYLTEEEKDENPTPWLVHDKF